MKIYTAGQYVTYNGQQWFITGFEIDDEGHTVYRLERNEKRIVVDETEDGHTVYRLERNGKRIVVDETEVE